MVTKTRKRNVGVIVDEWQDDPRAAGMRIRPQVAMDAGIVVMSLQLHESNTPSSVIPSTHMYYLEFFAFTSLALEKVPSSILSSAALPSSIISASRA